jgi:hypothetical protein
VVVMKASSKILEAWRHVLKGKDQLLQRDCACVQQHHFIDEHEDTTHDGKFQFVEKRYLAFGIHLPSQFARR